MRKLKAWLIVISILGFTAIPSFSQGNYINPDLIDIKKIRESELLDDTYSIKRLYIFLAIYKEGEFEAYVTRDGKDFDQDNKTVQDEPNDIGEYELLTTFSKHLDMEEDEHTCYITALPNFKELFPEIPDPFENDSIVEVKTKTIEVDKNRMEGSTSVPLVDAINGDTIGIERYSVFYTKMEKKPEAGESNIQSYGFIFMQIEETE